MTKEQIDSPCDGNCVIDPESGYCEGCWRTVREIGLWTRYKPEKRGLVYAEIEKRKAGLVGPAEDDF